MEGLCIFLFTLFSRRKFGSDSSIRKGCNSKYFWLATTSRNLMSFIATVLCNHGDWQKLWHKLLVAKQSFMGSQKPAGQWVTYNPVRLWRECRANIACKNVSLYSSGDWARNELEWHWILGAWFSLFTVTWLDGQWIDRRCSGSFRRNYFFSCRRIWLPCFG